MPIAKIEKLVFGGQALGTDLETGKKVFLWNALPGEEVEYEIAKKKKNYLEGIATKILKKSPDRIAPIEPHFLSCSPWQILPLEKENQWKQRIAEEIYHRLFLPLAKGEVRRGSSPDGNVHQKLFEIISDPQTNFHYRNKMEYSFVENKGEINLAFFERGKKFKSAIEFCDLAEKEINETAKAVLSWINKEKIPIRSLKSLILRSNGQGQTIAALFIKDELENCHPRESGDLNIVFPSHCLGFQIYYSTHKSPASVPTKLLYSSGEDFLISEINKIKLKFGLLSFFQVNIPLFKIVIKEIANFLDTEKEVIDYYSGVGAIGLPLAKKCKNLSLVESNEEAVKYAKENIESNHIKNTQAHLVEAEKMRDLISEDKIIIFDPPRAGIHPKIIDQVLKQRPIRVIYMSCNLSTHARDLELLQEFYDLKYLKLFNFFPRTPHIEALAVMERK